MENIFSSITSGATTLTTSGFFISILTALGLGLVIAVLYMFKTRHSKSFVVTLALLPAVVAMVIMMISGSIGAGIAIAGAFSLVRFRSAPGTAKEISVIFLAMAAGLACGMGYLLFGAIFTLIIAVVMVLYDASPFGDMKKTDRVLGITVPESLNYTDAFNDLFDKYTSKSSLVRVKTTNMGSMYKLRYDITLRDASKEKEFLDALRMRNGNLEVMMRIGPDDKTEL